MTWDLPFDTRFGIVARRGIASFVSLSALVSEIFKKHGGGGGVSVPQRDAGHRFIGDFFICFTEFRYTSTVINVGGSNRRFQKGDR